MGLIFGVLQDGWGIWEGWDDFQLWLCKRKVVEEEAQAKLEISIEREMSMTASMPSPHKPHCAPRSVTSIVLIVLLPRREQSTRYKKTHCYLGNRHVHRNSIICRFSVDTVMFPTSIVHFYRYFSTRGGKKKDAHHCQRSCRSTYAGSDDRAKDC